MAAARASDVALGVVMVVAAALLAARPGEAQSGGDSCTMEIVSLAPCLDYMSGNASTPKPSCCTALSSVVTSKPECLCKVLGGGASSLGVAINNTRALELPAACNVKTPPASQCKTLGSPVPAPAAPSTPGRTPPAVPNAPPAGTGSKATPTTTSGQNSSGESIGKAASIAIVIVSAAFALISA
ncbi:hypothetical protein ABZP36_002308 [Zizania latifolia]